MPKTYKTSVVNWLIGEMLKYRYNLLNKCLFDLFYISVNIMSMPEDEKKSVNVTSCKDWKQNTGQLFVKCAWESDRVLAEITRGRKNEEVIWFYAKHYQIFCQYCMNIRNQV